MKCTIATTVERKGARRKAILHHIAPILENHAQVAEAIVEVLGVEGAVAKGATQAQRSQMM
eukprot:9849352-Ditylum_brightwellii.AAC.1